MNMWKSIVILSFVLFFILTIIGFFYAVIGMDAGYYLSISRDLSQGVKIYKELYTEYPPIAMYFLSLPYFVSANPVYELFYLIYYLFILMSAFILFKTLIMESISKKMAFVAALIFIIIMLLQGGIYINLEPFCVFFMLLAYYFFKKKINLLNSICCGIFLSFAFLSKQYGILLMFPFLLFILLDNSPFIKRIKRIVFVLLGFIIPIFMLSLKYYILDGCTLFEAFTFFIPKGLLTPRAGKITGYNYSIFGLGLTLIKMYLGLYLIPVIVILRQLVINKGRKILSLELSMIIIMHIPLLFAYNWHYFQLITPWILLLSFQYLTEQDFNFSLKKAFLLIVSILLMIHVSFIAFSYLRNRQRSEQYYISSQISKIVPKNSNVRTTLPWIYFTCKLNPTFREEIGYLFVNNSLTPGELDAYINKGEWLIIEETKKNKYTELVQKYSLIAKINNIELYKK